MHFYTCIFLLVFSAISVSDTCQSGTSSTSSNDNLKNVKRKVVVDTDAGVDDAVAIFNLLGAQELLGNIEVKLITTVNGNTHVNNVGRNVLKILKTAGRLDIPVYRGANYSLLLTPPTENYFGEDGFGDIDFPDLPPEKLIKKQVAASALITAARFYHKELTLVCLGPLTNIALAIKLDPKFLNNIKEIYVLGGSDRGQGNIVPGIEFNFYMDPEAAFIVFKEIEKRNKTLTLIPWETLFERSVIDMDWRRNILGALDSPQVDLINRAESKQLAGTKWLTSDTAITSIVIDDSIIKSCENYHIDVEVCGVHSKGAIFVDYENTTKLPQNVRIITEIDTNKFKSLLLMTLNPGKGLNNGTANSV